MRKLIEMYCVEDNVISFVEENDLSIKEYTDQLTTIFDSTAVVKIETNNTIIFIKPSKLIGIKVSEIEEPLTLGLDDKEPQSTDDNIEKSDETVKPKQPTTRQKKNYITNKKKEEKS